MATVYRTLTRPAIRKLQPGERITERGITFHRLANGDGVFTVNIMVDSQRIHRTIGKESEGTTRTQAEDFIVKVKTDSRSGRLNLPRGRKVALSIKDAVPKYLAKLEVSGGRDIPKKRQRFNLHIIPFFKNTSLAKISSFDIDRYKKRRVSDGAKPGTINRELAALSHLFNKAEEWGWIDRHPKIRRMKEDRGRMTYLTVDQANRLLECAKQDQSTQIYPFILIALETSMRTMEILSIRQEHVDVHRKTISIPQAKSGARQQPITSNLVEFLPGYMDSLPEGCPWLFPSPQSKSGHTTDIRKSFRRVVEAAGLNCTDVVRHTLRHTAITHLVQSGVDLPTVARISGHKTLDMVARYAHHNGEHIQAAMDKLQNRYKKTG